MPDFDAALLGQIAADTPAAKAQAQAAIIEAVGGLLAPALASYGMDMPLRAAHFLAQTCEESDQFSTIIEQGSDAYFARYDGRFGNNQPGDGARFRGRGLIQITGRDNYAAMGARLGLDLLGNPALAAEPGISLRIACAFWTSRSLNEFSDQDDAIAVTWLVNGGFNGLIERKAALTRAKAALGITDAPPVTPWPTLQLNARGGSVASLQYRLRVAGRLPQTSGIDGNFGPVTEAAVRAFQQHAGLAVDGTAGPETWQALPSA